MKRCLSIFIIWLIALSSIFVLQQKSFALTPTFELYDQTSYPLITNINIPSRPTEKNETISMNVSDVSGVKSAVVVIKNSSGVEVGREAMNNITGSSYAISIDVTDYPYDIYYVSFIVKDGLYNSNTDADPDPYKNIGTFSFMDCTPDWNCTAWSECLGSMQTRTCTDLNDCGLNIGKPTESQSCACPTKNGATICVGVIFGISGGADSPIDSFTISPNDTTAGTQITLTATSSTLPDGEVITFLDETSSIIIGRAVISSDSAVILYKPAFSGIHVISAIYAGSELKGLPAGIETKNLTLTGICPTKNGATICVEISESSTAP